MAGSNGSASSDSSTTSHERFRRRQRRRLLETEQDPQQFGRIGAVPSPHPADLYLRYSPSGSARAQSGHSSSNGETSKSRRASTSRSTATSGRTGTAPFSHQAMASAAIHTQSLRHGTEVPTGSRGAAVPSTRQVRGGEAPARPASAVTPSISTPRRLGVGLAVAPGLSRDAGPSKAAGPLPRRPRSGFRTIRLGIETEFYLSAYSSEHASHKVENFVKLLATEYNARPDHQYKMRSALRPPQMGDDYSKWSIVIENTNGTLQSPCMSLLP
jgi:hypothetical protein